MLQAGDVGLAKVQFTDTFEVKVRPALVLFEEFGNVVVAGITSNTGMKGIPLTKKEGAIKESIIKLNYIFTLTHAMIEKSLFQVSPAKKRFIFDELMKKMKDLSP